MWIETADLARTMDERADREFGLGSAILMERAGSAVFDAVAHMLPDGGRITVFCGKGNNGGDGFVVARIAHQRGFHVECLVAADEPDLNANARYQMGLARESGVEPIFHSDVRWSRKADCVGCRDVVVDALLGTGAKHEVQGPVREAIEAINRAGVPVIAVDVPSGIDCDTGEELGESVWALKTVTLGRPKPFLFQGIGLEHSGYWEVAEIGYPPVLLREPTEAKVIDADWVANLIPERMRASHKGDNGRLVVVAGSVRMRGAAVLSTLAALRSGIGLVTVAASPEVCDAVAQHAPEATFLPLPSERGLLLPEAADILLAAQSGFHSALFGPGLTHEPSVLDFLRRTWRGWQRPCVIDADGLNAVARGVDLPESDCVLTPHPGEMSRLLECSVAEVQADRFVTVAQAVAAFGQTVLLKGPYSIVGTPGEPLLVNPTGNPGQATGGMGDVLAGVIATLLAQDLPGYFAAAAGMYWHGAAADQCAAEIGSIGYTASEVAAMLPRTRPIGEA